MIIYVKIIGKNSGKVDAMLFGWKEQGLIEDYEIVTVHMSKIMTLDELTKICGYFTDESGVNNHYNCLHPECGETEYDEWYGKDFGKCIHFLCPLASDYEEEGFEGFSGDHRMIIHDKDLLNKLQTSSEEETEK